MSVRKLQEEKAPVTHFFLKESHIPLERNASGQYLSHMGKESKCEVVTLILAGPNKLHEKTENF